MSNLLLPDILARSRSTSTYTSLMLSSATCTALLSNPTLSLVVLAPANSAIESLPLKVWQLYPPPATVTDAAEVGAWFDGEQGQARAKQNEETFGLRHVVVINRGGGGTWGEGERMGTADEAWEGRVWWEARGDDKRVIMPGEIEVVSRQPRVENGELWIINGTVDGKKD